TDQLDAVRFEDTAIVQLQRDVQRRLAAHGGEQGVRPFTLDDALDPFRRDRLDVRPIRQIRIGHDRRRIAVDQDDPVPLFLQGAHGLGTGVIELAALPDHDRARAEDEDALDVVSAWHGCGLSFALPALEADRGDGDGDEPAPHDPGYDDEGDYGGARHVCSRQVVRDRTAGGGSAGRELRRPTGEG